MRNKQWERQSAGTTRNLTPDPTAFCSPRMPFSRVERRDDPGLDSVQYLDLRFPGTARARAQAANQEPGNKRLSKRYTIMLCMPSPIR